MVWKKTLYERKKMPTGKWQFVSVGHYEIWSKGASINEKLYREVNDS